MLGGTIEDTAGDCVLGGTIEDKAADCVLSGTKGRGHNR